MIARRRRLNSTITRRDATVIRCIVQRATELLKLDDESRVMLKHDIALLHANGCRLDLVKFAQAPDFDFAHDVQGIGEHLDRTTGYCFEHFEPRCARQSAKAVA